MGRSKTIADDEILAHARRVFREGGHAASTRDVAQAAGISQAVLYQRFGSKEELFFRAMAPESPDLEALLGPYPPRDVRADLTRIGERIAEYIAALMPTLLHVLAHPRLGRERLMKLHQRLAFHPLLSGLSERFARLRADKLVGEAEPAASAQAFLAVIHVAALSEVISHGVRRSAPLDALLDVLWTGIAPASPRPEPVTARQKRGPARR